MRRGQRRLLRRRAAAALRRRHRAIAQRLTITEQAVVERTAHFYDKLGLAPCPEGHRRVLAVVRHVSR